MTRDRDVFGPGPRGRPAVLIGGLLCALCAVSLPRVVAAEEPVPHASAHAPPHGNEPPARPSEMPRASGHPSPTYAPRPAVPPRALSSVPAAGTPARPIMNNGLALDARHNHGRYYAPVGAVTRVLPPDHRPYYLHGRRYYFSNGAWYVPRGGSFVVVPAPVGIIIASLPPFCTTVWYAGVPYYYADNAYYAWQPDQNGYAVVDPPDGSSAVSADGAPDAQSSDAGSPPMTGAPGPGSSPDFFIYPKNGQSKEQQAADQYDCGNWAKAQSGFDPAAADGGVPEAQVDRSHANYDRAWAACLQGRGYQLN